MNKKEKVTYEYEKYWIRNLYSTKYDDLFTRIVRDRGLVYYLMSNVTAFNQEKNKISAVVKGTSDYHVSIEYLNNNDIKVECECLYHKDKDVYCKHAYALLLYSKMVKERKKMARICKNNRKKILELKDEIDQLVKNNKKYFWALVYSSNLKLQVKYNSYIKDMDRLFDEENDYKLSGLVQDSYCYLNIMIDDYNKILDEIEEGKKELEKKKNEPHDTITYSFSVDESAIFKNIDDTIANYNLEFLMKARYELMKENKDTSVIDKAIKERRKRDKVIRKNNEIRKQQEKKIAKRNRRALLMGLIEGLSSGVISKEEFNSNLMSWEEDAIKNDGYEPFNFEEEELEEDDYYFDDDK